jgi:hypothetical protein
MNTRELVDHIRSGRLDSQTLRFREPSPSNPCDFNDFLQAQPVKIVIFCKAHLNWASQKMSGSRWSWRFMYQSIQTQVVLQVRFSRLSSFRRTHGCCNNAFTSPNESIQPIALANALQQHTALQEVVIPWRETAPQDLSVDTLLRALPSTFVFMRSADA